MTDDNNDDPKTLDRSDELSDRFSSRTQEARDSDDTNDTDSADGSNNTDNTDDTQETRDTGSTHNTPNTQEADTTRSRKQYTMYLPPEVHEALERRYKRLDGEDKVDGGDGIEKHKDFNEALVWTALDSDRLDSNVLGRPDE